MTKKKTKASQETGKINKAIIIALVLAMFVVPVYGQTQPIIKESLINTIEIDTFADAPFNQSNTSGACNNRNGTTALVTDFWDPPERCPVYFGFNITDWNRDRIADVFFSFEGQGAFSCFSNPQSILFAGLNGTLDGGTFNGLVFNDSLITAAGLINSSLFPQPVLNQRVGFNKTELISCTGGGTQPRTVNVTQQFSINYDLHLADSWTLQMGEAAGGGTIINIHSRESATNDVPNLTIAEKGFRTVNITTSNSRFILFDFEGNRLLTTNTTTIFDSPTIDNVQGVYDFVYDVRNNILKPVGALGSTVAPAIEVATPRTDLEVTQCGGLSYTTDTVGNINSQGGFERICFNLSSQHNGTQFFGVFQLINNTCSNPLGCDGGLGSNAPDVNLFAGFLSPSHFDVQFISVVPPIPSKGERVIFTLNTNALAKGFIQYRTAAHNANKSDLSQFSNWFTINGSTNATFHQIPLDNVQDNKFYQFFAYAIDNSGARDDDNNTDLFYNFTVGAAGAFRGNETAQLGKIIPPITDKLGIGFSDFIYVLGMVLLMVPTTIAWRKGGMNIGVGVFATMFIAEITIGLLPFFLFIPVALILTLTLTSMLMKKFGGGS